MYSKLLVNNKEVPLQTLAIKESVWQYYSIFIFQSTVLLSTRKCTLSLESRNFDLVITRYQFVEGTYLYTAVSERAFNLFNSTSNPVTGVYTAKNLLNNVLGFRCDLPYDSSAIYWILPKLRVKNLIDKLNLYTIVGNGGGSHFYIDLDGFMNYVNFKWVYDFGNSIELNCDVESDEMTLDWAIKVPSVVDFFYSNVHGSKKETLTVKDGYSRASAHFVDTTGYYKQLLINREINDFYNAFFTSRTIAVSIPIVNRPKLGNLYNISNTKKAILTEYEYQYPLADGAVNMYNLKLSTCPL